jgi:hypothetical protein
MLKTALRRYLRGQAVNDEKFQILKDAARAGDFTRVDDSFLVLKPKIVKNTWLFSSNTDSYEFIMLSKCFHSPAI